MITLLRLGKSTGGSSVHVLIRCLSTRWMMRTRVLKNEIAMIVFIIEHNSARCDVCYDLCGAFVNSVDGGIRSIYAGGFEKGGWYSNVFVNFGVQPMFAMEHHGEHSKRKRMLSNIYAKSTLQKSPALTKLHQLVASSFDPIIVAIQVIDSVFNSVCVFDPLLY